MVKLPIAPLKKPMSTRSMSTRSMPTRSMSRGVTLLEIMIVLIILAGALAIAWPSLQRPLNRLRLDEASQMIREAIDESRQRAISRNQSMLIHLRKGDQEVQTGSIESFAKELGSDGVRSSSSITVDRTEQSSIEANDSIGMEPQVWRLPDDVVVVNVESGDSSQASNETDATNEQSSMETDRRPSGTSDASQDSDSIASRDRMNGSSDLADGAQEWWVPLDAQGTGFDAKITLLDKVTNKNIYVSYSSATGHLEISR